MRTNSILPLLLATLPACLLPAMLEGQRNTEAFIAAGSASAAALRAQGQSRRFAVTAGARLCPTAEDAGRHTACSGGIDLPKNAAIQVVGEAPQAGVWPVAHYDRSGAKRLFIAAGDTNELPDLTDLQSARASLQQRYPAADRIPDAAMNLSDLLTSPQAYRGHRLVWAIAATDMADMHAAEAAFSFTLAIPTKRGARGPARGRAQFDFASRAYTSAWSARMTTGVGGGYSCGPGYCDQLAMVAELTGSVERVDAEGHVMRVPAFRVLWAADRFGQYAAD